MGELEVEKYKTILVKKLKEIIENKINIAKEEKIKMEIDMGKKQNCFNCKNYNRNNNECVKLKLEVDTNKIEKKNNCLYYVEKI